jgi:AAA domain
VLVTAKTAEALTALHNMLPEGIRDLAISVIHHDREGARQLERAVEVLANEAKQIKVHEVARDIVDRQRLLADTHDRIATIEAELLAYARRNLEEIESGGQRRIPMEIARHVAEDRGRHIWFEDSMDLDARFEPRFSDAEIAEAREARQNLAGDIVCSAADFPDPNALIDVARLLAVHKDLTRYKAIDEKARAGNIPYMGAVAIDHVRTVHIWLNGLHAFFGATRTDVWLVDSYQTLCGVRNSDETAVSALKKSLNQWARLYLQGRDLALKGIDPGDAPIDDQAFDAAVAKLARGEKPFGLLSFLNAQLKIRIDRVTVGGSAPSSQDAWQLVQEFRTWHREAQTFLRHWSAICATFSLPPIPTDWETGRGELIRLGRLVASLLYFASQASARVKELQELFPYGVDAKAAIYEGQLPLALEALATNLEKAELAEAHAVRAEHEALVGGRSLPFQAAISDVCAALGDSSVATSELAERWRHIREEATRLAALRPLHYRLDEIVEKIRLSGAPIWANKLATVPARNGLDSWTPVDWRDSWDWKRADGFVRGLADRTAVERLSVERAELEAKQRTLLAEVVRLRTFLGLKQRMSNLVEVALAKFSAAVARLGAGTGRAAGRHRRVIREATLDAAAAVPCWILPEWRVSEQLPAELAAFDLVIIDEASQSDITALPAILRGKKLLIVGDDKQVSPTHVGLEERTVIQLRTTFLHGLPFADQMDPATSLYELGGMLFPGKAILLREHFRCVEPIIRFSSRFYRNLLVPMRLPTAPERLDPPLVDIIVRDGEKKGDLNRREAEVIVEEIRCLSEDPTFANRTIGVISLIGDKQAKLIYDRLMKELGAEVMERHRIMCGNAAAFQGQERNIIFLSMVACPKTAIAQRSRMYEQRFNVAMSRARDRLVLVRSITSSDLKPGDLKLQGHRAFSQSVR